MNESLLVCSDLCNPADFNLDNSKPAVIGECSANGTTGHTLTEDVASAFQNGWAGIFPWTSNGVDTNGGWNEVSTAANAFIINNKDAVFPQ